MNPQRSFDFKLLMLWPLALLFWIVVQLRNFLFDHGWLKTQKSPVPVVTVGNLSLGGTGKTPHVAYFLKKILQTKKKVCVVSRGYGGHYGGYASRVRLDLDHPAAVYGDEPVYYAKHFTVPVYVAHDRSAAVQKAFEEEHPDLILSDDGFQHRWMERTLDIVLLDSLDQVLRVFPLGRLREPFSALKRADIVILTKTNFIDQKMKQKWMTLLEEKGFSFKRGNLFLSSYAVDKIELFRGTKRVGTQDRVFLASTIARPESFYGLMQSEYQIQKHFAFSDHKLWKQDQIDQIETEAVQRGVVHLLITEKDAVKMDVLVFRYLNVHVVTLGIQMEPLFPIESLLS